jgi:ribosomal protein S18 acetylase RimI-like enzyme
MTLVVRRARPSDAAGIATVHVGSWQRAYRGLIAQDYLDSLWVPERTRTWEQILGDPSRPGAATLVAELDGEVIGFASTGPSRDADAQADTGELWGLYLDPDRWGSGHGHTLYTRAMGDLRASGVATATLWVLTTNQRARRFYEQHGWLPDGAEKVDRRGDLVLHESRYRLSTP